MKEIINGRMYNTETAQKKGSWDDCEDPDNVETLYQKKNGEYFLEYSVGPYSIYAIWKDDIPCGRTFLKPISISEAVEWSEDKLSADEYEELFGEVSEGAELRTVSAQLTTDDWDKLHRLAEDQKTSISKLISKAIKKEYLK